MKTKSVLGIIITGVVITSFSLHNGLKNIESKSHCTNVSLQSSHNMQLLPANLQPGTHHLHTTLDEGGVKNLADASSRHSLTGTGIGNGLALQLIMHGLLPDPGTHAKFDGEVPGHSILLNGGEPIHTLAGTIIGNGFTNTRDPIHGKLFGEIPGHSLNNCGPDPAHGQFEGEVPGHGFALIEGTHNLSKGLNPGGDPRNGLVYVGQDPTHGVALTGEQPGHGFANNSEDPGHSFANAVSYI